MSHERYGVIGWPVKHSVSPEMQEAGMHALGRDASYVLVPIEPENLPLRIAEMKTSFRGWNITVPHKGAMIPLLDEVDPAARIAGSVNTVVNDNGYLRGFSTDGYGLETAILESFEIPVPGHRFVFWGTGGAARATACSFAARGAAELLLVNRTVSKAEALADAIRQVNPDVRVTVKGTDATGLRGDLAAADVVVQSSSIGLQPDDPPAISLALLTPQVTLLDMIYRRTKLLDAAESMGCRVTDGKSMLLHQGVKSLCIWTGCDTPPVEPMREALYAALQS
jgi:shikimate dehydrogenase